MPTSKETRQARHEHADAPRTKRGTPHPRSGKMGDQSFTQVPGKGLVHLVKGELGWNEMSISTGDFSKGRPPSTVISRGGTATPSEGGVAVKNVNNSYTGADSTVQDAVFVDTSSDAYIRGVRSQNNNLSITVVDSVDYGSYINFNAISGTGIESVQSYSEVSSSYATAIGANTNLKFASDYDSGASTGIFFTATDDGNDTILTPTINFPPDTNTTYATSWVDSSDDVILRLAPSSGSNDDLKLVAGPNIYLTPSGDNMTIASNNTTSYTLSDATGVSAGSSQHGLILTGGGSATTAACLRNLVAGTNITMTTTDTDTDTGYIQINANLSAATISTSYVNPLGGYFTQTTGNLRFIDGGGIVWALAAQGSNVTTVTPSFTTTYDNYQFWTIKDGDTTTYTITSGDTLQIAEGNGIDVNFTADDVLTITNTAPNTDAKWTGGSTDLNASNGRTSLGLGDIATRDAEDFALVSHNHSAANITSGTLAVARGGTGVTTVAEIKTTLSLGTAAYVDLSAQDLTDIGNLSGTNTGDQTLPTRDSLGIDTDDAVTFAALTCSTLNTGQGATEVYLMNQNVKTDSDIQFDSFGVGTAASGTTGEIRATNEVTAYYSDDRLKTRHGNIEKALEKVCSLNGFHYSPNELAGSLGYDTSEKKVGVSAQEVLKILPEAVTSAPIDPQYHAVQYDKLVPLLVEAIKELSERKCSCGV
jgi:hypothetical protein